MQPMKRDLTSVESAECAALKAIFVRSQKERRDTGAAKLTQESAANFLGDMTQGAVSQYLNGDTALNLKAAIGFAKLLKCRISDFSPRLAAEASGAETTVSYFVAEKAGVFESGKPSNSAIYVTGRLTSVFGEAMRFDQLHTNRIGSLSCYSDDKEAFAIIIDDDSLRPRIRPGEFIVCEPGRAVLPGDDVVVVLKQGRRLVKELLWQRDSVISLGSINSDGHPTTMLVSEIETMHYISSIVPRGGLIPSKPASSIDENQEPTW